MSRKSKTTRKDITLEDPPTSINPYNVLGLEKNATSDEIKKAYHRAALKHHPDKTSEENKDSANEQFKEIAFAYAILSDERRKKRYDSTGNTSESLDLDDDDFSWTDFFREQSAAVVDGALIDKIKEEYQGSEEEKGDILEAYEKYEGDLDGVYEDIMCSNVLDDDERFRKIIDSAIKDGQVEAYKTYTKETKATRKKRVAKAKDEESEAMELADELGVKEKLFGATNGHNGKKKRAEKGGNEDALKALIQQRQKARSENFFDQLEDKYGGSKKGKRKDMDEPPEEAFQRKAKKKNK